MRTALERLQSKEGSKQWYKEWKERDDNKNDFQRGKDRALWEASRLGVWEEAAMWLENGATNDYINQYDGSSAFSYAKIYRPDFADQILTRFPDEGAKEIALLRNFNEKYFKELKKMVQEDYAADRWLVESEKRVMEKSDDQMILDSQLWLVCSAERPHWDVAVRLVGEGATCDYVENSGWSAIHHAVDKAKSLQENASVVRRQYSITTSVITANDVVLAIIKRFPKEGQRRDKYGKTAMAWALENNKYKLAVLILAGDTNPICSLMSAALPVNQFNSLLHDTMMMTHLNSSTNADFITHVKRSVESDLSYIKTYSLESIIGPEIFKLVDICRDKYKFNVIEYIKKVFGQVFDFEPLTWRYLDGRRKHFLAAYFKRLQDNRPMPYRNITFQLAGNVIEVSENGINYELDNYIATMVSAVVEHKY